MRKLVWITIFTIISLIPLLTTVRVIALQNIYNTPENYQTKGYSERGIIFDRNGNILAMQIDSWDVGLRLIDTKNPTEVVQILSQVLNIPYANLSRRFENPERYVTVKRLISKQEYETLQSYQNEGKLHGVQINIVPWRKYPGNESMSHVIGYYGVDGTGLDGIESSYNKQLQPLKKNKIGNSVYLTIDSVLQKSIEEIVKQTYSESNPSYITTILLDAKNGEILAYVEIPNFDLNTYYTYSQSELSNKIVSDNYEPGSVFKIFSMAAMIDSGTISPNDVFDASEPYVDPDYGFVISDVSNHGIISASDIIKYSSNVGMSLASYYIDASLLYSYLKNFGFGDKVGINLPGESKGVFFSPKQWSARSKATIAFGQEISVNAMQIVSAATAIASKGKLLKPHIVKKITSPNGHVIFESKAEYIREVIDPSTAQIILKMMEGATEGGTARRLKEKGINISAKTGTAQVYDPTTGTYSDTDFIASTLAIAPTEDPQLIIYSAIHKPTTGETYGGRTTAPMIKKIFNFVLPYMGLVGNDIYVNKNTATIPAPKINSHPIDTYYENYTGLSKREIWNIFANSQIQVNIHGSGNVISQSPAPGASIDESSVLDLYFE